MNIDVCAFYPLPWYYITSQERAHDKSHTREDTHIHVCIQTTNSLDTIV